MIALRLRMPLQLQMSEFCAAAGICFKEQSCFKTSGAAVQRHNEISEVMKRIFISALNFLWKYQPSLLEWNDLQLNMRVLSCPELILMWATSEPGHQQMWAVVPSWGNNMWPWGFHLSCLKWEKKKSRGKKRWLNLYACFLFGGITCLGCSLHCLHSREAGKQLYLLWLH